MAAPMTLSALHLSPHALRSNKTRCVQKPGCRRSTSRIVYDFSMETLLQYTHLRQIDAARALGVATITLKRICQRRQLRWPYGAKRRQAKQALDAAQAMMAMKAAQDDEYEDGGDEEEEQQQLLRRLPSYCVYKMPMDEPVVSFKQEKISGQRLSLPGLKATDRTARMLFQMTEPLTEPTPSEPRLTVHCSDHTNQSPLKKAN